MRVFVSLGLLALVLVIGTPSWGAAPKERKDIPEKYTWDLRDLFPSVEAWRAEKVRAAGLVKGLETHRGKLGASPAALLAGLEDLMAAKKSAARVYIYAMQLRDQDTAVAENAALEQEAQQLQTDLAAAASFFQPEILGLAPAAVRGFVSAEPKLAPYTPFLEDLLRRKPHTLASDSERVVALAGGMKTTPDSVYGTFTGADLPYPEITLSTGEKVTLDPSAFTKYRAAANREDRIRAFEAFFGAHDKFRGTLGALLYGQLSAHRFEKEARGYASCLESALDENAIPVAVYEALLKNAHDNLRTLHRYLGLRQKMMGVDALRYEDLYAPTVKGLDRTYTPEEAMEITLAAFAPLGADYVSTLKKGYESRWVDWYPSKGKRSGAYSEGAGYDVHPYELLNFNGRYTDVSTLAHESGHSMHFYLSNHNQPYVTSEHAIFVAEVASTLNEALLFRYSLSQAKSDDERLFLLNARLDSFRQTLFRQTMFAEFELKSHQMAERGEPVTGEALSALYLDLVRTYYGHGAGVCRVEDYCAAEWEYIHHFWAYDFYVYQYATSLTASTAIAKAIREEAAQKKPSTRTRDAYVKLLSSGCSKYPIDLLKEVGVDMTGPAPFKAAMDEMNEIMDQMEAILAKKKP